MAGSKAENQVTFSAASSVSVTAGSSQTSDEITLSDNCFKAEIGCKADNSTTPASDDQIYVWALYNTGDPDGASTDEFDTDKHAELLGVLDTYASGAGEDPAKFTVPIKTAIKSLKIRFEGATAGTTNSITCSAAIYEHRWS